MPPPEKLKCKLLTPDAEGMADGGTGVTLFGYSLKVSHRGTSNKYPQQMFSCRNKKIMWIPLSSGVMVIIKMEQIGVIKFAISSFPCEFCNVAKDKGIVA